MDVRLPLGLALGLGEARDGTKYRGNSQSKQGSSLHQS